MMSGGSHLANFDRIALNAEHIDSVRLQFETGFLEERGD